MNAGRLSTFFPQPLHDRLVADTEGAVDAAQAHPILVGAKHLLLYRRTVAWSLRRERERALAVLALGPLRPAHRVPVLVKPLARTMWAAMHPCR